MPAPARRFESGLRLASPPEPASAPMLEDASWDELTPPDGVLPHLVAVTASRDDALDDVRSLHDDAPTVAMPVDVGTILSILAANGLESPLGIANESAPAPEPPRPSPPPLPRAPRHPGTITQPLLTVLPPPAIVADYARQRAPTFRIKEDPRPKRPLELALVAGASFLATIAVAGGIAWALGVRLLGN